MLVSSLANPYGTGNHRRISWRKAWVLDHLKLTAQHVPTRFTIQFTPHPDGGYTAQPVDVPPFGPDGTVAMDQMFGLRELLKDGWEIFHTLIAKHVRDGAPNDATGCASWIDSKKELPPGDVEMVLVCYVGLNNPQVEEGAVEVSRAEYVREEPSAYPFWMLLPEPAKRPSQR